MLNFVSGPLQTVTETPVVTYPPASPYPTPPDPLSLARLAPLLRRRFGLFAGVFALVVEASLAAALLLPVQYTAATSLTIDPRPHSPPASGRDKGPEVGTPDSTAIDTEVQLMRSPAVFQAVAARLDLAHTPDFHAGSPALAAEKLARHVSIGREALTYVVSVRASAHDPAKAAQIANAVAAEYMRQSRRLREAAAADQARTLDAELVPFRAEVLAADAAAADYRAAHGLISGGEQRRETGTVNDQQITTIASELGHATADAAATAATAAAASRQASRAGVDSVSQVLASQALMELRKQRADLLHQQAQITSVYGPEHPATIRINEQVAQLDRAMKAAGGGVVGGLKTDAAAAAARAATLTGRLATLQAKQGEQAKAAVVADGLQRDADAKRETFNELARNAQAQAQEARIGDTRAWVVAPAGLPLKPSFPKKSVFLMLGVLLGSAAGSGAVLAAELASPGFRAAEEVEGELGLPYIASVPELPRERAGRMRALPRRSAQAPWEYVLEKPNSSFAEAYRNIRATLLPLNGRVVSTTICITSALPGEGKTTTAATLARVMAMRGDRVLLVDCDLRRTRLGGLGRRGSGAAGDEDETRTDLVQVLQEGRDPRSATREDVVPGLTVLGLRSPVFTARDLFSGDAAKNLLARLKAEYDFVILDAPPVLSVTDAWVISALSDTTLLVARESKTPRGAVRAAVERLRQSRATLHGVVLNRRVASGGLGAGDPARYRSAHAPYYQD